MLTYKTKNKIKNNLTYYIFALLVTILIFVLWQGFREKPITVVNYQTAPKLTPANSGPNTNLDKKIFFASNGKDTAYKIKRGDKWSVIFKDVESKEYDFVSGAIFSSDGSQFAFSAENDGRAYVVVNNTQEIIAYKKAGYMVFNPAGTEIAFVSIKDSGFYVIITAKVDSSSVPTTITGTETQEYDQIGTATDSEGNIVSIIYSSDGEEIAYIIEKDDGVCVVVNGEEGETYDSIKDLYLNDDGTVNYTAEDGNETIIIVNNTTTSTSTNDDDNVNDDSNDSSSTSTTSDSTSTDYKYKIITDKDIDQSDSDEIDITTSCTSGQNCNF